MTVLTPTETAHPDLRDSSIHYRSVCSDELTVYPPWQPSGEPIVPSESTAEIVVSVMVCRVQDPPYLGTERLYWSELNGLGIRD